MATGRWLAAAWLVLLPAGVARGGEEHAAIDDRHVTDGGIDSSHLELVPVENPGNRPDRTSYGAVVHRFRIARYELTNREYVDFLNAVAAEGDPYSLYHAKMGQDPFGGILRRGSGTAGDRHVYILRPGWEHKPVNFVSFYDAVRYVNWLHNGRGSRITEDGSYTILNGRPDGGEVSPRLLDATWVLPSEDEWYKAAYYDASALLGRYWLYPTRSNVPPTALAMSGMPPAGSEIELAGFRPEMLLPALAIRLAAVGSGGADSEGYYGTYDQGGNVREWTETADAGGRVVRGGSWWNPDEARSTHRGCLGPGHQDALTGIRVALLGVRFSEKLAGRRNSMSSMSRIGTMGGWAGHAGGGFDSSVGGGLGLMGTSGGGGVDSPPTWVDPPQGPLPNDDPPWTPTDPPNPPAPPEPPDPHNPPDPKPVPTPEPATVTILTAGALALTGRRRA